MRDGLKMFSVMRDLIKKFNVMRDWYPPSPLPPSNRVIPRLLKNALKLQTVITQIKFFSVIRLLTECQLSCMMKLNIWKFIHLNCGRKYGQVNDHRSHIRNLSSCEKKAWKNSGLIAQLLEHCTGIAEVMGSNPVQAFQAFFSQLLSCVYNCDDHSLGYMSCMIWAFPASILNINSLILQFQKISILPPQKVFCFATPTP